MHGHWLCLYLCSCTIGSREVAPSSRVESLHARDDDLTLLKVVRIYPQHCRDRDLAEPLTQDEGIRAITVDHVLEEVTTLVGVLDNDPVRFNRLEVVAGGEPGYLDVQVVELSGDSARLVRDLRSLESHHGGVIAAPAMYVASPDSELVELPSREVRLGECGGAVQVALFSFEGGEGQPVCVGVPLELVRRDGGATGVVVGECCPIELD